MIKESGASGIIASLPEAEPCGKHVNLNTFKYS